MTLSEPITPDELRALAAAAPPAPCERCVGAAPEGWDSMPGSFDRSKLVRRGTLAGPGAGEATLREYHPQGTHGWSPDAPIAPGWFPYNRCEVWACTACGQPILRYTEHGGYYEDERVRRLGADLIVDAPAPPSD